MEREACVCDHGFERSDLCAEIIIIIIIIRAWFETTSVLQHLTFSIFCRRQGTPLFFSVMTLAVRFAFEFQGRNFELENRKALVPSVICLSWL